MKWSLLELKKYRDEPLVFSEVADVSTSLSQRDPGILAAEPVKVTGTLTVNQTEYIVSFNIETILTLSSTRSLEPVPYPMSLEVMEIYMTPEQFASQKELLASDEIVMVLEKDLIDLTEAVEDHLLLALPLKVLTEEEKLNDATVKGQSWELMSEDAYYQKQEQQEQTNIDPRLAKLSALLDNNKDSDDK